MPTTLACSVHTASITIECFSFSLPIENMFTLNGHNIDRYTHRQTRLLSIYGCMLVGSVLQCVAVCCSVSQYIAVCCSVLYTYTHMHTRLLSVNSCMLFGAQSL